MTPNSATSTALTEGPIGRQLVNFALPILLSNLFQQLYNLADAAIVGNFVGKAALGAVSTAGYVSGLLVAFFVGLSAGAGVVIAQAAGAGDARGLRETVHTAMAVCLPAGLALTALGFALSPAMLRLMNTPADAWGYAVSYLRIYFLGLVPIMLYNLGSGILRAVGDSRRPFWYLAASSVLNVALDLLFVVGLGWETAGAAWATLISQTVAAALLLTRMLRANEAYRLRLRELRIHGDRLLRVLRVGLPTGVQSVIGLFAHIVMQAQVNGFGTSAMAGLAAFGKINNFLFLPLTSLSLALTTFAGQNFGARRYDRVRRGSWLCFFYTAGFTLAATALVLCCGSALARVFTKDGPAIATAARALALSAPFYIFFAAEETMVGYARGSGHTLVPMLVNIIAFCGLRVTLMELVMPYWHDIRLVALCYPASWAAAALALGIYVLMIRKRLAREASPVSRGDAACAGS